MTVPVGLLNSGGSAGGLGVWGHVDPGGEPLELADLVRRPDWHARAACKAHPDLTWFPDRGDPVDEIKAVCAACPVVDECLAWALAQGPELHGWWGGLNDRARRRLRKG